ncbi:cobalt ECF transporter T component CbiQ [Thermaerobacillus caldiproteolyticus]|uniref:cobalt ECF transporter T component CbiQ n=1 Tax=Thermaerobacillus caldiproteolyticus TaxID=247480 RepID=UPI00188D070B|nr:cobalt ECF transporter T component CbiQ [Anoxybacillus caldiproteolyticus]QPA32439.1 cobalt ECF transporter T component CbiQ [Anoxybacillus caldiproteolyticus]
MMSRFDTIAYNNRLRKVPPEQKVFFSFLLLFIVMLGNRDMQTVIIIWLAVWIVWYARVSWQVYVKALLLVLTFLCVSFPLLIVSIDHSFHISVNSSNISLVITLCFRSIAAWSCLFFLLVTTPFTEFLYTLKRMKVPSIIIELLFLTYRFVFVFARAADELHVAMKARSGGNHWRHAAMLIFQLIQKTWLYYEALSFALRARSFSGEITYVQKEGDVLCKRYLFEAIIGVVMIVLLGVIGGELL